MLPRRLVASSFVSALIGLSGVLAVAQPVAAAEDDVITTAKTVYTLDARHGQIKVAVDLVVKNRIPSTTDYVPCTEYLYDPYWGPMPYASTCPQKTSYYVNSAFTMVENEATNIRATSGGSSIGVKKSAKGTYYRSLEFSFGRIWNGDNKQIHLTYTIPGGKPRSANPTRAMRAYTNFCATSHGVDGGSVQIRIPAGFDAASRGSRMHSKQIGSQRVFSSGPVTDWASWYACVEGSNEAGYKTSTIPSPDGTQVILKTWPEDPKWAEAVRASISTGLTGLTRLVGTEMSAKTPLVVKESVTGSEYAGFYSETSNTIVVDEDYRRPGVVQHELAHVWFNGGTFEDTWIAEGQAEWAARTVGSLDACRQPAGTPGSLATWQFLTPKATDKERAAVDFEYDASCWVVTKIAETAGEQRMTIALAALLDGVDPYAIAGGEAATGSLAAATTATHKAASWQRWLDAMDELALEPAGASPTLASDLLVQFGATEDEAVLDARAVARSAYHELAQRVSWTMPTAVRAPLSAWDFTEAQIAIDAALPTWTLTGQTDTVLDGVDARSGPAAKAWASATTASELTAAAVLAKAQLDAASDVADAMAVAAAPRDVFQEIGLIGTSVPSIDPALAAVRAIDTGTAATVSASIRQTLVDATAAGQLRAGIAGAVALLLLLVGVAYAVRRSRRRRAVASVTAMTEPAPVDAVAPIEPLMSHPTEP